MKTLPLLTLSVLALFCTACESTKATHDSPPKHVVLKGFYPNTVHPRPANTPALTMTRSHVETHWWTPRLFGKLDLPPVPNFVVVKD